MATKLAYAVSVYDHAVQQTYDARLLLSVDYASQVEDFKLIMKSELDGELEAAGFVQDLRESVGDQLDGTIELEELDGMKIEECLLAGHWCEVTLTLSTPQEGDDE